MPALCSAEPPPPPAQASSSLALLSPANPPAPRTNDSGPTPMANGGPSTPFSRDRQYIPSSYHDRESIFFYLVIIKLADSTPLLPSSSSRSLALPVPPPLRPNSSASFFWPLRFSSSHGLVPLAPCSPDRPCTAGLSTSNNAPEKHRHTHPGLGRPARSLRLHCNAVMVHAGDPNTTPPTPSSPPGMTTSKSSKSSSFQSTHSDDSPALGDIGHFEDIGLDDDSATLKSPHQPNGSHRRPSPSPGRTLASSKRAPTPRSSFPNLRSTLHSTNPRSTSLTVLTDPSRPVSPGRRSLSNHSTSSLPLSGRRRSPSPSIASNPRGPSFPPRPRRGSWQSNHRKSFAELEHECDEDEGDDIPDGLILDNVPISPRPPSERPASRPPSVSPSPDRAPKERVRSVGNGTPPVAQAQGSLKSPTWKSDTVAAERSALNPLKSRAHSWNSALAGLSAEAKALTEKLEQHADEEEERSRRPSASSRPNTWNSTQRSADYALDRKERGKSTPELPPLRRTHVMIDPLPVSKEKEAVLSRTRPSWLPPKDPAEERRHLRQYEKMMAASAKADERREAARRSKAELRDTSVDGSMQVWENDIIPRWNDAIRERRTRELWWRGVPPRSRGLVWLQAIGNELGLSESSFETALERAKELEARVKQDKGGAEDVRKAQWFEQIRHEAAHGTWKDLCIFDVEGPLHRGLVDVLMAYAMYRSDIGYVSGCNVSTTSCGVPSTPPLTFSFRLLQLCSFSTFQVLPQPSLLSPTPLTVRFPCRSIPVMPGPSSQRTISFSKSWQKSRVTSTTT